MAFPILDQIELSNGCRVILYDMPVSGALVVRNLVCENRDGTMRWTASPGEFGPDTFVAARIEGNLLLANTWSCYAVRLDLDLGREISRAFTK